MDRVSMTRFKDAFNRVRDYAKNGFKRVKIRLKVKRRKYVLRNKYARYRRYVSDNLSTYGKTYGKYFAFEFLPYVTAYGLMINFPLHALLGMAFTVQTVISWGLVFYFVSEELTSIFNEMKPYIRVSAKVDN